jgi:hypothetical protein
MFSRAMNRFVQRLRRPRVQTTVYAAIAVAAVIASACSFRAVSDADVLVRIVVTPNTTLAATTSRQMQAMGLDAHGRIVNIASTWSVVGNGGRITPEGVFTAGALAGGLGDTVIAWAGGISGRAAIRVTR